MQHASLPQGEPPSQIRRLMTGFILAVLLAYPLLFFAHKYTVPWTGMSDFRSYHAMTLAPLEFDAVRAPFAMRQLTPLIARGLMEIGVSFNKEIWFQQYSVWQGKTYSDQVFFALLLANAIGAVLAGAVVYAAAAARPLRLPVDPFGLCALALLLLSGGTMFYVLAPLTEGWTWFLAAAIGVLWRRSDRWAWAAPPLLLVCVFQREMLPLAFLLMASVERLAIPADSERRRYLQAFIAACIASLLLYIALRSWILPMKQTDIGQIQPLTWWSRLIALAPLLFSAEMIKAAFFKLNMPLLWGLFLGWMWRRGMLDRELAWRATGLALAAVAIFCISWANGAGKGVDRLVMILTPLFVLSISELAGRATAVSDTAPPAER